MGIVSGGGGGGGGSQNANHALMNQGASTLIADGANALLPWGTLGSGVALLGLTDPLNPTAIVGGIYAATATVWCPETMTVGGAFQAVLHLDGSNEDAVATGHGFALPASTTFPTVSPAVTFYVPAGGIFQVRVSNFDGAAARHFQIVEVGIQKLS